MSSSRARRCILNNGRDSGDQTIGRTLLLDSAIAAGIALGCLRIGVVMSDVLVGCRRRGSDRLVLVAAYIRFLFAAGTIRCAPRMSLLFRL